MQVSQNETERKAFLLRQSPFVCIKCHKGYMMPVIEEGEPDYTEHYACIHCNFHDTIPTLVIIASQIVTALLGVSVSIYLAIESLLVLSADVEQLGLGRQAEESALLTVASLFTLGFVYVLYQSFQGLLKRRAYLNPIQGPQ